MHKKSKQKQKGFTLIELLVVISIIGFISTLILASVINARKQARDANRKATVSQIQKVLELYKTNNGVYPGSPGTTVFTQESSFCTAVAIYISDACNRLKDPQVGSYVYMQPVDGGYFIGAKFEVIPSDVTAAMFWTGGYQEPAGWFYMYRIY